MSGPQGLVAEKNLFELLTDSWSMESLVLEGFSSKYLPTADIRFIFEWALKQYMLTGNIYAPTAVMFQETDSPAHKKTLAEVLDDYGIDITNTPDQTIEWCIQELRAAWLRKTAITMLTDAGTNVSDSMSEDMQRTFSEDLSELVSVQLELESKRTAVEMVSEADDIKRRYDARKADQGFKGLTMGLQDVDNYTNGIQGGDLAFLAGPQKSGKSYFMDRIALKELEAGHTVTLVTLENGIDMTIDRIACLATGIHPRRFKKGQLTTEEEDALATWIEDDFKPMKDQLWIVKPPQGQRTAEMIVSMARTRRSDSLLIDQLLWMEDVDTKPPLNQRIRHRIETIKAMIESSAHPMPCLMAHQVNRKGIENAQKADRLWPNDMAEGAAVEQGADWVFSIWQSDDMKVVDQLLLQTLAARSEVLMNWDVYWNPETGVMRVLNDRSL